MQYDPVLTLQWIRNRNKLDRVLTGPLPQILSEVGGVARSLFERSMSVDLMDTVQLYFFGCEWR